MAALYYKESLDDGVHWQPDVRLTDDPGESREPAVALSATCVHVVWHDDRDGNWEIYQKRGTLGNAGADEPEATTVFARGVVAAPSIFGGSMALRLDESMKGPLQVVLYDVLGAPVCAATYGAAPASLRLRDVAIARLAPGVYFLRLDAGRRTEVQKLVKVK